MDNNFSSVPNLRDHVAIITGASSGIGRAAALALASSGVSISLAARSKQNLEIVAHDLSSRGGQVLAIPTDVGHEAQVENLVTQTYAHFGRLDILITSAGGASF